MTPSLLTLAGASVGVSRLRRCGLAFHTRHLGSLCLAMAIVLTSSCSFTAVTRVPGNYKAGDDLGCTSGLAYPLIDMAGTVLSGVLAINLLSTGSGQEEDAGLQSAGLAAGALALALASSAIYGTYQVNRCRRARNAAGLSQPDERPPMEDRVPPGSHGGACLQDGSCDDDYVCDAPMQTCVPEPEEVD